MAMRRLIDVAGTGVAAILLHPARSLVTVAAVVAGLLPYLVGLGISTGMRDAADAAVRHSADLYVTGVDLGRPVPVPAGLADEIAQLPGVDRVVPRIVGRIELGTDRVIAVVVGVPLDRFPSGLDLIEGRLYAGGPRNELVIGSDLAQRLNLKVGSYLPPFYQSREGERVSEVVGIFRSDVGPWQSRLIVTSFETAARIFDRPGLATDIAVYCRPRYAGDVRAALLRPRANGRRLHIVARDDLQAMVAEGPKYREGSYTARFVVVFVVAVLVLLVTSGVGVAERRREVGILKAIGWQTDELLLRSMTESLVIAAMAGSVAIIGAVVWLKELNGYGLAGIFLPDAGLEAGYQIPFRLVPVPVLLVLVVAVAVVSAGSLYSTWRATAAPPAEAVR
jgi:ABC-type lipoprotein release transport system permease subunit